MTKVKGWVCWEHPVGNYQIGTDSDVTNVGKSSGFVTAIKDSDGFGTIMQKVNAKNYLGKRMRFAGFIKAKDVDKRCGFFMEVFDGIGNGNMLGVDNMMDRSLTGTTDWQHHQIVLDVPDNAFGINIGARLCGNGKMWIDGVTFEEVGKDVPTTQQPDNRYALTPQNLDFTD